MVLKKNKYIVDNDAEENTHHKGKHPPMTDLQFNWIGFDQYVICVYWNYWIQTSWTGEKLNRDTSTYSEGIPSMVVFSS